VSPMGRSEGRPPEDDTPWAADEGPEPEWADAIREGRKRRSVRLRAIFEGFDDAGSGIAPRSDPMVEGDDA
jgi:hypothetical protein